jgi:hypothetical protein
MKKTIRNKNKASSERRPWGISTNVDDQAKKLDELSLKHKNYTEHITNLYKERKDEREKTNSISYLNPQIKENY